MVSLAFLVSTFLQQRSPFKDKEDGWLFQIGQVLLVMIFLMSTTVRLCHTSDAVCSEFGFTSSFRIAMVGLSLTALMLACFLVLLLHDILSVTSGYLRDSET